MNKFQRLFGIKNSQIKRHCLLLPLIPKGSLEELKISKLFPGKLYSCGNNDDFSLIHTGMHAGLLGDAVLYLKDSPCEKIILFGSCGLVSKKNSLAIGSLATPFKCYSWESFSDLLLDPDKEPRNFFADRDFLNDLLDAIQAQEAVCASVSSLKLEEERLKILKNKGIEVVDMECSAFFSASESAGIKAAALFYISDIFAKKPFYLDLNPALKIKLSLSIKKTCNLLRVFLGPPNNHTILRVK
ncbi:MAG: hypothetical protein ABH882_02460 [Candidatus Omnitrophota bacterium]|nr:hypothetical protein [Candidatus Omnitrophota bacterium]MBU1928915.1 hypothetical protein [Candidatus Omnitrophota bacterium]MBU2258180.1 hypothetical protein [Candidatus Omnitrophota bacterium]